MKKLLFSQTTEQRHWVGDGFPVRSIFSYNDRAQEMSPFLLMDYAGPAIFPAATANERRGVGEHPHRGFETVTIVYDGQVEHRDSAGGGGIIGPGDVQWMTAASGLVHEEFHGPDFAKKGGRFEMVQLWVNLPRAYKMSPPRYQGILSDQIPVVSVAQGAGTARIIAGEFEGQKGPAMTFSSINLWDIRLTAGAAAEFTVPQGQTASVFVLDGKVRLGTGESLPEASLAVLDPQGERFTLAAESDAKILFMGGEPLHEPVVGYGPFVMNSKAEILQAITDYQLGRMGQLAQEVVR
ncbi:MAG: quercetin 2,3-dioxygenase [Bdellovibrio sp. ArHS]|uniref:pirin family protein n=1 Tax=Bdellovibrio sp. ArHS TaxID=1569284 RepID=UPI0005836BD4|nr:pirin family protein [Bdellovibrio sp. ArHS]KHD87857.1 MAG: quercetin 2,3-dioxygenase [Bdellovibrio sp. ArHS]